MLNAFEACHFCGPATKFQEDNRLNDPFLVWNLFRWLIHPRKHDARSAFRVCNSRNQIYDLFWISFLKALQSFCNLQSFLNRKFQKFPNKNELLNQSKALKKFVSFYNFRKLFQIIKNFEYNWKLSKIELLKITKAFMIFFLNALSFESHLKCFNTPSIASW